MSDISNVQMIDKYWRAANYLTVAFMYLQDNIFLERNLSYSDLKTYPAGHWGTSPGINFIIAHLNSFITKTNRRLQLVIGPGHAGNALFAHLILEGTLQEYYPIYVNNSKRLDINRIQNLIAMFRTEVNPFFPGTIYDGGELGYSLPVSFGSIFDAPDLLTVCIIGDGEFETGTISSSWRCNKYIGRTSGKVLPIIHLNGYRMGDYSLLSGYSDNEILLYFQSLGYRARFVNLDHQEMIDSLNWADSIYKSANEETQELWPILILKSNKGCTAPDIKGIKIQGTVEAHKNPLKYLSGQEKLKYLQAWLNSYSPRELFDNNGVLSSSIYDIIPTENLRIGKTLERYNHKKLQLTSVDDYSISQQKMNKEHSNISVLEKYLMQIMQDNKTCFRIVSPDELKSNMLGRLKDNSGKELNSSQVLEILNENICQGWLQGYIMTGRNCLMISYESFMPIIDGMVSQFSKWLFQVNRIKWRPRFASIIYILTSLWEENTYSHQNPGFINHLMSSQHGFVRIYMPIDANSLLACVYQCLSSENQIHLIIVSKQPMPQILEIENAKRCIEKSIYECNYNMLSKENADLIIAAAGDYPERESIEAIKILRRYLPEVNIKNVAILELTSIGDRKVYSHAMCNSEFDRLFPLNVPIVFCFHGYPSAIKSLLFERIKHRRIHIMGYNNQSLISSNHLNKMILNGLSRYHIVLQACLYLKDKISKDKFHEIEIDMKRQIETSLNGVMVYD